MKTSKRSILAFFSGCSLLILAACSNPTATQQQTNTETPNDRSTTVADAKAGEINIYSARHYDTDKVMYDKFTENTGIKVNIIEGKDDQLIERIKSEGTNSPADVLITVDVARLTRAQQAAIFQSIDSEVLESAIPQNLQEPQNFWFGFSKRARVIVYNTAKVKESGLSTYEALAEPKWKGRICMRSSSNVYNQSLVASEIAANGVEKTEKWLKALVNNFARPPQGNDINQIEDVASGQCDVALVNQYYFARLKESKDPKNQEIVSKVALFFPKEGSGTHINISGAGVVVNAPHKENAIKFLEFLASSEGQELFADANNEYPAVSGVKLNPVVESFGNFSESKLNIASFGDKNAEAVKLMDKEGWK